MKYCTAYLLKTVVLIFICHIQLSGQNVGIGSNNPTSKLHLKSTIQNHTALNLDFETGIIDEENTGGDTDWYITETDGYNSAKCAKVPMLFVANQKTSLKYGFNMTIGKEVTVSFNIKFDDPSNMVDFSIYSDHFSYTPSSISNWKTYSKKFVSQSSYDVISFDVKANQNEAFPIVHIDNILITYADGHVLKIEDGTQGDGLFLQSDALGQTEWFDLRAEVDQKIDNNFQELEFDTTQNALFIEDGNGVLISSLKNHNGKSLRLSGSEIIGSPGMSLHLPNEIINYPTFHFDAANRTMDWGLAKDTIKGFYSTRWGYLTAASGYYSSAWGLNNSSTGTSSTSWGSYNKSSGYRSTAWGLENEATGENCTSFGFNNISSGEYATSWGEENLASGYRSTAWGGFNSAGGYRSTAWGHGNQVIYTATNATACGGGNVAKGFNSFVTGHQNEVNSSYEAAFGRFNISAAGDDFYWESNDMLFTIGNGTSDTNRKNVITVLKNGNVGIAEVAPSYDLHLKYDSAAKPGSSAWTVSSDRRLKKDITEFTDGLDIISAIEPVWFTYNGLADIPEETYVGTIAQDLEEIAPYMVSEFTHKDGDGNSENYKAVNYGAMDFVLINAIKELKQENIELKAQINEIMSLLDSQKESAVSKENE